jgi:hypothetical protein
VYRGIDVSIVVVIVLAVLIVVFGAQIPHGQNTGIFPQVVSCVPEHPPQRHTGPDWQPTLKVTVEPARDPGRVREYHVFGCTFYDYFAYFR